MSWFIVIALLLTSSAVLTRLGAREAEQRYPPAGEFAQINGLRMHYTDVGSGPAVVLVHGASTSLLDFQASIAGPLSEEHRVIAADIRSLSDFLAVQSKRYGEIRHPVLAVTGEQDHIVPAWNHVDRLVRQIPHVEHFELEDTGHALHHAHPEHVADLVASFSRRLPATDPRDSPMAAPPREVSVANDTRRGRP